MDFGQVDNILVSAAQSLEKVRPGFVYVNVVLYATKVNNTTPLIFGYVYKNKLKNANGKNSLKHWMFVNR